MAGGRKLVRARKRYEKLWGRTDSYLGSDGKPSPLVGFGETGFPGYEGSTYVYGGPDGVRKMFTSDKLASELGGRTKLPGLRSKKKRRRKVAKTKSRIKKELREGAKGTLLHEWAHIYQDPEVIVDGSAEGGADLFKRGTGPKVGLKKGWERTGYYPESHAQEFIAKYGADAWERKQFGQNWGKDPRTIKYPGFAGASKDRGRRLRRAMRGLKGGDAQDVRRAKRALKGYGPARQSKPRRRVRVRKRR